MEPFPHQYSVSGFAGASGDVELGSKGLPLLHTAPPPRFGGPGDLWSPETLLVGAVADCFILTFQAVTRASGLKWIWIECDVTGTVDRVDRVPRFTTFRLRAHLMVPEGVDAGLARRVLEKAERSCLISNSLNAPVNLELDVQTPASHHVIETT
jgi:organic hydroperoxide reductase OsmC/OhrA